MSRTLLICGIVLTSIFMVTDLLIKVTGLLLVQYFGDDDATKTPERMFFPVLESLFKSVQVVFWLC